LKAEKRSFSRRLPSNLEVDNTKNAAILRDFLQMWKLTTSQTQQFCEISFNLEVDNTKRAAILRDFLQNGKSSADLNYGACRKKVGPGHTKCCTCHAKEA